MFSLRGLAVGRRGVSIYLSTKIHNFINIIDMEDRRRPVIELKELAS
jgi:hypothetical protein